MKNKKLFVVLLTLSMMIVVVGCSSKEIKKAPVAEAAKVVEDNDTKDESDELEVEPEAEPDMNTENEESKDKPEFSWGQEEYGTNGWVFTPTGNLKMQIPEGWEVAMSMFDTAIAVQSGPEDDADEIRVFFKEYSADEPAEKRNPENQVTYYSSGAAIVEDKWGNTDVWYRTYEWSDKGEISGFAAYDEEKYVRFTITLYPVNGTTEEFMKSNAWETLRTTFELQIP